MSPVPSPALQAGDDVDASFFDQLGDELDFPVSGDDTQRSQDSENTNLAATPEAGEHIPSATRSLISKETLQGEDSVQEDSNTQLDFELDDSFSGLKISEDDSPAKSSSSDLHHLSNGDIQGENSELNSFSSSTPDDYFPNDSQPDSSRGDLVQDNVDSSDSLGKDEIAPNSSPSEAVASPPGSSPKDMSGESTSEEEVKLSGVSKSPVATVKVTEVQWSDFGASAGFGSFSDLLSSFPADPSQQIAETFNSGTEFFQLTADPPLDYGSYSEEQMAAAAVFDLQQANSVTQTLNAAEIPSDLRNPVQESQTSVFPSSEELNTSWQSQGQQQPYIQSDQVHQSEWQNPYPGWWYNVVTGEWLQENSSDNGTGGVSSLDTNGQYGSSGQTGNEQGYWQDPETIAPTNQLNEQTVYERGNNVTSMSSRGEYGSQWNGQNQGIPSAIVENPLFEETIVQEKDPSWQSSGEAGAVQESASWEDQYPGWFYDYQAQEWKQTSPPGATGGYGASEASDVLQQLEPSHSRVEGASSNVENQSQRYDSVGWSAVENHQETPAVHYTQETPNGYGNASSSVQFESISSSSSGFPTLSTSIPTVAEVDSRQWTEAQSNAQSGQSSSYYSTPSFKQEGEVEQSQVLNDHYSLPPAGYSMQQPDQQSASQPPEPLYNGYATSSAFASSYSQIPQYETNDMRYNQFSGHQVPGFTAQTWPTVSHYSMPQHTGSSYQPQTHSGYDPMTPPKSVDEALRTSVGRPAHALTSFGFGGKLLIMKLRGSVSLHASDGTQSVSSGQVSAPGPIHVQSLSQIVAQSEDQGRPEPGKLYFNALARQAFSGPLAGGSVSSKELFKWLDERISNCRTEEPDCRNAASLSMLWGLLKVACQHYGKLRSAMGTTGLTSQEEDGPEVALANLLTSGANQGSWSMGTFASTVCLQPLPSEHQLQATATEVKKLLVMGKRKEALNHALQGQLWGPALVLARQLGEKFYSDAVAQMAQCQFLPGSPLRTLSLLIAGQPADVFTEKAMPAAPGTSLMQNPATSGVASQDGLNSMLEEWQENLSIMAANRTNGDDRVISHLGDCLWKVKGEVAAAHICYLVADAVFEPYTSTSRLCLTGADHWSNPRTFATPEAIQRTEVYEYSKVLGNSQFTLVPFQPYKLIYASMLAEAGKTNEALRYCQAVLKTLKTASRAPEVETCRQAAVALEERLRIHTQGGHTGSLAPAKIVGKLFSVLDRGIHGIIGGPPQSSEQAQQSFKSDTVNGLQDPYSSTRVGGSPDRAGAPLVPSLSAEKLKDVKKSMPPRSISEPDFGSASMKGKSMETKTSSGAGGYLGRLSSSLFQKAGGIVGFRKKEAKLGEKNKFYYDEKLKKWVEEGVDPVEEAPLPPPPTAAKFSNKVEEPTPEIQAGLGDGPGPRPLSGTPPVPPSNQFSARTKQGVRSRYVDTFNKGGTAALPKPVTSSLFPALQPVGAPMQPMSFFVPGPSADSSKPENGITLNEENHTGNLPGIAFDTEDRTGAGRSTSAQNSVQQNTIVGTPLHRVGSAENAPAAVGSVALEEENRTGRSMSNGGTGLANGYHSRANSWGGYPSNFQSSQFVTDGSAPSTSFSGHNGFLDQSSATPTPTVNSYFVSPPTKVETFYASPGNGTVDASLPTPPSIEPFTTSMASGVLDERGGVPAPVSLAADDLQEVVAHNFEILVGLCRNAADSRGGILILWGAHIAVHALQRRINVHGSVKEVLAASLGVQMIILVRVLEEGKQPDNDSLRVPAASQRELRFDRLSVDCIRRYHGLRLPPSGIAGEMRTSFSSAGHV
ncbi:hypothetical protein R1sor_003260 [Riccia sorocarpa]|uniref:Protein transport protein sec16 n=1 Tax=Riccia sorocarpa TaxID=122646 RepID=A0ABD3H1W0_9MARC